MWSDSVKRSSTHYNDGVKTIYIKEWYEDGLLASSTEYLEEKDISMHREWYSNGNLKIENSIDSEGTYKRKSEFYEDGNKRSVTDFSKGEIKLHRTYYPNKNLESETSYYKEKNVTKYWENGNTKSNETYAKGKGQKIWTYYDRNGNLIKIKDFINFKYGQEFFKDYIYDRIVGVYSDRSGNFHLKIATNENMDDNKLYLHSKSYSNNYEPHSRAALHEFIGWQKKTSSAFFFEKSGSPYIYEVDFKSQKVILYKEKDMIPEMTFWKK